MYKISTIRGAHMLAFSYLLILLLLVTSEASPAQNQQFQQKQQLQQQQQPFGNIFNKPDKKQQKPLPTAKPTQRDQVVDQFNLRNPDGSYEFRYELSDGTARYERGYFLRLDKLKSLVVVGYYSYRLSDGRYLTVFYNADQFGYRQNQSITPQTYPNLPRSIEVPSPKDQA